VCGFVFFELPARRSLPRPWLAAVVLLAGIAVVVLLTRGTASDSPAAVPVARAEPRLERQLGAGAEGLRGSVHCPGAITPGRATRCQFLYADGDTQLMLVTLMGDGALDIDVPFPAQRRPGR
jgi:hypothetical protein